MTIVIEDNVPIPLGVGRIGAPEKYPFERMNVGQSFFAKTKPASLKRYLNMIKDRLPGKFVAAAEGDGTRVWRVE